MKKRKRKIEKGTADLEKKWQKKGKEREERNKWDITLNKQLWGK